MHYNIYKYRLFEITISKDELVIHNSVFNFVFIFKLKYYIILVSYYYLYDQSKEQYIFFCDQLQRSVTTKISTYI